MRTAEEALNALLDKACAKVDEKAAKREALRRTFKAGGRTMAEFAEMYGMGTPILAGACSASPTSSSLAGPDCGQHSFERFCSDVQLPVNRKSDHRSRARSHR